MKHTVYTLAFNELHKFNSTFVSFFSFIHEQYILYCVFNCKTNAWFFYEVKQESLQRILNVSLQTTTLREQITFLSFHFLLLLCLQTHKYT